MACQGQTLQLIRPNNKMQRKCNAVNTANGTIFTTLQFIRNFQIGPISKCYINLGWRGMPGTNTPAF
jgi:hypothetical protein